MNDQIEIEVKFADNIFSMSNERLCEVIVAFRYLGTMKEEAVMSMEELARRRGLGDQFEYEKHIESVLSSLPKFDLDLQKIIKKFPKAF